MTYAIPAIEAAMRGCAAHGSFSPSLLLDCDYQLHQVAFLCATFEQSSGTDLLTAVQ